MAAIVQSKPKPQDNSGGPYTITLDGAAGSNYVIYLGDSATQVHTSGNTTTFNGSNMTTDLDTEFGLKRLASILASGGTSLAITLAGTSNFNGGIALEFSGITGFEAGLVKATATGSGTGPYSCAYASGAANRIGFVLVAGPGRTFSGANGSSVIQIGTAPSTMALIYKDALGSAAGSIDFTVDSSGSFDFFGGTYLTAGGSSQGKAARLMLRNVLDKLRERTKWMLTPGGVLAPSYSVGR